MTPSWASSPSSAPSRPVVSTIYGRLRGVRRTSPDGRVFFSFKGVPYGAAPVGELRFQAPRPPQPWSGVRNAVRSGPMCPQPMLIPPLGPKTWSPRNVVAYIKSLPSLAYVLYAQLTESEDCLRLNVATPQLPSEKQVPRLPVVVFVHGGGFRLGDGDALYGAEYFMDLGGIVVVTFNYRLGPLGFLAVGTEDAPGNAGLKDQVLALRWVRDNIAAFGGDPDQVTLYGESAGAVSAHLHTISPMSRGLFHRVIAGSSLATCSWAHEEEPLTHARALARALGVPEEQLREPDVLAARLRAVPARSIIREFTKMTNIFTPRMTLGMAFVPVVEPPHPDAFLAEDPVRALAEGRQADVPMMTGNTSREGLLVFLGIGDGSFGPKNRRRRRAFMSECVRHRPADFLPTDLHHAVDAAGGVEARDAVGAQVLRLYFGEKGPGLDNFDQFIDLFGDAMFVVPVLRMSRLHSATSAAPVFHYYFEHDGEEGTFKTLFKLYGFEGASHADELGYLFRPGALFPAHRRPSPEDARCKSRMLTMWASFIRTGDPTPEPVSRELGVTWLPRDPSRLQYLNIGTHLEMRTSPSPMLQQRLELWDELYRQYLDSPLL